MAMMSLSSLDAKRVHYESTRCSAIVDLGLDAQVSVPCRVQTEPTSAAKIDMLGGR